VFTFSIALLMAATPGRVVVDTHLHVTMSRAATPLFRGAPGEDFETWSARARLVNQVEADQLLSSGTTLILGAMWVPLPMRPGRGALDETLNQLRVLRTFVKRHPAFAIVESPAEARQVLKEGRIAVVPAVEGGEGISKVEDVDRLYAAGARAITLVHFVDNAVGGASYGQFAFNFLGKKNTQLGATGLSELGTQVVTRMLDLGMMVDLAHASDKTSDDVLRIAEERQVPVINSHGGARALLDIERNIPDALAARIAKLGGTVGVTIFDHMVGQVPDSEKWDGYVPGTCDDIVAHWKHLGSTVGYGSLTLGSDFNGLIARPPAGGSCPHGIRNASDLNDFYETLVKRGVPKQSLDTMGEHFLGMWETLEKKSDPGARSEAETADAEPGKLFDVAL
jgi:membrane dipeptidase